MTVEITFALTDGAILMTDGRRTNLQDDSMITDAGVKILGFTPSISAATHGSEPIIRFLGGHFKTGHAWSLQTRQGISRFGR